MSIEEDGSGRFTSFFNVLKEIYQTHLSKSQDYGTAGDPYANIRSSEEWGVDAWKGALIRQGDKIKRLQNAANGCVLVNESVEDSLLDNASYAIIALVLWREGSAEREWPAEWVRIDE